ncbi:methyltransferase family protein [Kineothrix alysoides]|uniref:Methyltransferase family protein n=1 Tax=Kineothrix alysoides TaxID=1469948 RepID=A0A4R1QUV4_9FIRM|nr:class I SAM-dependent methyltransferase [Kineothrix alysoides]TCL57327.1 methyltransferase family protein [Kineothrix alysoides]
MRDYVVESYENYHEENRLTTNKARKIEFITTSRIMNELLDGGKKKILDCAAGTGIYAFYLQNAGHEIVATDITPRHVEIMKSQAAKEGYQMRIEVMDATDMSRFADESFDIVLNMGPFYHLVDKERRLQCLKESLRVLRKGGILMTAYIPRFYVFQYVAMQDTNFLDTKLAKQLIQTGELHHNDDKCFWTDTYYSTADEMEKLYEDSGLIIVDHFAQDGLTPQFASKADAWTQDQFNIWCEYHYSICREKSVLGASNHVIVAGKK